MKNRELIKALLDYLMDVDVVTSTSEDIELSWVGNDKMDAKIVFIDGCDKYCDVE